MQLSPDMVVLLLINCFNLDIADLAMRIVSWELAPLGNY